MNKQFDVDAVARRVDGLRATLSQKRVALETLTATIRERTEKAEQLRERVKAESSQRVSDKAAHMALVASVLGGSPDGNNKSGKTGIARMVEAEKAEQEAAKGGEA